MKLRKQASALDFLVDTSTIRPMDTDATTNRTTNRRIVGFSLSLKMASDVKAEAGRRGISLRKLFEELWALYQLHRPKS